MNGVHVEGNLSFHFGARWTKVLKWDDCEAYRSGIGKLAGRVDEGSEGTKAVDFVAIDADQVLWFIEVKDFEGHLRDNLSRLASGELALEVALKVRDTLAGLVGHCAQEQDSPFRAVFERLGHRGGAQVRVVLWLEHQGPPRKRQRDLAGADAQLQQLKHRMRWLTKRVQITDVHNQDLPDLRVKFRERPPS